MNKIVYIYFFFLSNTKKLNLAILLKISNINTGEMFQIIGQTLHQGYA